MPEPTGVVCPHCTKINSSKFVRCIGCNKPLRRLQAKEPPPHRKMGVGIPWRSLLIATVIGAGIWLLVLAPWSHGTLIGEATFSESCARPVEVETESVTLTVTVDWETGRGEIVVEQDGEPVLRHPGEGSHMLTTPIQEGRYEVVVLGTPESRGRVRIWLR